MSETKFPQGWDEQKVRLVLDHYDRQTDEDAVAEDEAAFCSSATVMEVPYDLVSEVRELIAKHRG